MNANSRAVKAILANIGNVQSFTLDNGFRARECKPIADFGDQEPWA